MPSPLPPQLQLSSSHTSATPILSYKAQQNRKASTDKPGLVQRTSSSTSLHRSASNKSNSSSGTSKQGKVHHAHGHHPHVAHTSASAKHHRATSFGHRVPSYGKGLNKLTALTTVEHDEPHPQQPGEKQFLTIDSLVARAAAAGGTSMQRSLSEGSTLAKKDRRQSGSSVHSSRPRVRRPKSQQQGTTDKHPKQHVTFSTHHSSDEDEDDEIVHRKSSEIVASPISRSVDHHQGLPQNHHHISPAPPSMIHRPGPQKSALKEHLSSSAPKFLQKNISQVALVPPKVSITNAVSKDLTKLSTSVEQALPEIATQSTPSSEPQMPPSSNPVSHFITSTPPSRNPRTPDLDMTSIRRNQSSASLAFGQDHTLPLTSTSQGKLTRTQQKLLLQRASTQPQPLNLALTTSYSSPSLAQVAHMETAPDYFSPLPTTPTTSNSIGINVNMTYDVKVAREFERISRELVNARRFGDPTGDALARLRNRINPSNAQQGLNKKQSAFGLSMSWKRSPDKHEGRARIDGVGEDGIFGGERRSKVREVMRRLWFDEVDVADVTAGSFEDDGDDEVQVTVRSKTGFKGLSSADSR